MVVVVFQGLDRALDCETLGWAGPVVAIFVLEACRNGTSAKVSHAEEPSPFNGTAPAPSHKLDHATVPSFPVALGGQQVYFYFSGYWRGSEIAMLVRGIGVQNSERFIKWRDTNSSAMAYGTHTRARARVLHQYLAFPQRVTRSKGVGHHAVFNKPQVCLGCHSHTAR